MRATSEDGAVAGPPGPHALRRVGHALLALLVAVAFGVGTAACGGDGDGGSVLQQ